MTFPWSYVEDHSLISAVLLIGRQWLSCSDFVVVDNGEMVSFFVDLSKKQKAFVKGSAILGVQTRPKPDPLSWMPEGYTIEVVEVE